MLLIISLLLIIMGTIKAQATFPLFCGNLPEVDCEIIQHSASAMGELESIAFNLHADLTVHNLPEVSPETFTLQLDVEGSVGVDSDSLLALQSEDLDTDSGYMLMVDILRTVNADISLTLDLPSELRDAMEQSLPETLTVDFRMIDGVVYINLTELANLNPLTNTPGWVGLDLVEFYNTRLSQIPDNASTGLEMMSLMQTFIEPHDLAQFIKIERLSDTELSGQNIGVFEMQFDYVALAELPIFEDMLISVFAIVLPSGQEFNIEAALNVIREIYSGISVTVRHNIGLEDLLIHETNIDGTWDLTPFTKMSGETTGPVIDLQFTLIYESYYSEFVVPIPESIEMLPLSEPNE